ncbi:Hypothetical predicted protein [Olea europaea subsp. europaea]|uniref:Uncharacterized protein n=1 Tax=Olea europaea subsp. europaea TaxID=158383 RepID=A0A8S0VP37_OLEEU|nr:Hypothetical predicted protein [Olea europaea subsp. europaea]
MSSMKPKSINMGIAENHPRQLASSVGNSGVGSMVSPASIQQSFGMLALDEEISFGSLLFTPHQPGFRPAFAALQQGVDLTFGGLNVHIDSEGSVTLPDSIISSAPEGQTQSTPATPEEASSDRPLGEPVYKLDSGYCLDCSKYHGAEPYSMAARLGYDYNAYEDYAKIYNVHQVCVIQGGDAGAGANGANNNGPPPEGEASSNHDVNRPVYSDKVWLLAEAIHRGDELNIHPDGQQITMDVHAAVHWLYLKEKQKLEIEWDRIKARKDAADASEIRTESIVGRGPSPKRRSRVAHMNEQERRELMKDMEGSFRESESSSSYSNSIYHGSQTTRERSSCVPATRGFGQHGYTQGNSEGQRS